MGLGGGGGRGQEGVKTSTDMCLLLPTISIIQIERETISMLTIQPALLLTFTLHPLSLVSFSVKLKN